MKQGDFVRFAKPDEIDHRRSKQWDSQPKPWIGVLVDHDKLMGTAQVLHEGTVYKVRTVFVQKAGRKDFEKR